VIYTLQYLRALAVILVVMSHIAFKSSVTGHAVFEGFRIGASGVDIFFVVSGLVMAMIYTRSHERSARGIGRFWVARFSRIFPLYWLVTSAALVLFLANPSLVNANSDGPTSIWRSYTLIPTLQQTTVAFLIGPGWSLSFELYFYVLFSAAFLVARKTLGITLVASGLVILAAGSVTGVATTYLLTSPLLLEFVFGMAIFKLYDVLDGRIPLVPGIVGIVLGVAGFVALNGPAVFDLHQRWWQAGLPSALLVGSVLAFEARAERMPSKTLLLIGDASYALYLVHVFVLGAASRLFTLFHLGALGSTIEVVFWLGTLGVTVVAGCVTHVLIERPMNRWVRSRLSPASSTSWPGTNEKAAIARGLFVSRDAVSLRQRAPSSFLPHCAPRRHAAPRCRSRRPR